ncbi:hypothetical protein BS78_06G287400 [Paspalum vaginatum]|nr:hypothetical protein BS78_06G287400 [Paspalum vaginatum]
MGSSRNSPIVISDDEEEPVLQAPAAVATVVVPGPDEQEQPVAAEDEEWPGWLPDGFEMEGYYLEDGKFQATSYTCPASGFSFSMKSEVLQYCHSGALQRAVEAKATLDDKTTLQGKYAWLRGKHGWVLEIRAGQGESKNKMFKFYAHLRDRVRLASKDEVIRYIDHAERPESANGDCDTRTEANIVAQLEFSIKTLPPGWVKETVFRANNDGTGRKLKALYTDPISKKVFRSLKAAEQCFATGEPFDGRDPIMSVTEKYSFDWCTDMKTGTWRNGRRQKW